MRSCRPASSPGPGGAASRRSSRSASVTSPSASAGERLAGAAASASAGRPAADASSRPRRVSSRGVAGTRRERAIRGRQAAAAGVERRERRPGEQRRLRGRGERPLQRLRARPPRRPPRTERLGQRQQGVGARRVGRHRLPRRAPSAAAGSLARGAPGSRGEQVGEQPGVGRAAAPGGPRPPRRAASGRRGRRAARPRPAASPARHELAVGLGRVGQHPGAPVVVGQLPLHLGAPAGPGARAGAACCGGAGWPG